MAAVLVAVGACLGGEPGPATRPGGQLSAEVRQAMLTIRGGDIIEHAKVLCDRRLQGRESTTPGARQAAGYIAEEFRKCLLRPGGAAGSYYQAFKIRLGYRISADLEVRIGKEPVGEFRRGRDYAPIHLPEGKADLTGPCVLAGYGITAKGLKFDEYQGLDAKGKAVIVFSGAPWSADAAQWIRRGLGDQRYDTLSYKARNAAEHGAACLLVVDNPAGWRREVGLAEELRLVDTEAPVDSTIPVVHITRRMLADVTDMSLDELRLLAADIGREMESGSMLLRARVLSLKASISGRASLGRNVVAILPGWDERLRTEAVVLGAHYDHLGGDGGEEIYFGANDNAAGVGALLSIARAMTALPRPPRRTVVFVAFDAEEVGRRGSRYYVAHPAVPIDRTVMMINFDMIGRNEPDEIFCVGARSSEEVHRIHQEMNRHVGLRLRHPGSFRLGRSDHSTFYSAGVPILYLFGGLDVDYNTPNDTWDKLLPSKVERVARLAMLTALEVAQADGRPRFDKAAAETPRMILDGVP